MSVKCEEITKKGIQCKCDAKVITNNVNYCPMHDPSGKVKNRLPRNHRPSSALEYIYFIQGEATGKIKIGYSKHPYKRMADLQVGSPDRLRLLGIKRGTKKHEAELHRKFESGWSHGEWFEPSLILMTYIEYMCDAGSG